MSRIGERLLYSGRETDKAAWHIALSFGLDGLDTVDICLLYLFSLELADRATLGVFDLVAYRRVPAALFLVKALLRMRSEIHVDFANLLKYPEKQGVFR